MISRPATPEHLALLQDARRHPIKHRWQQRLLRMRLLRVPLWRRPLTGMVFAQYLILTGIARFFVEFIRINPRSFFGMTNAQTAGAASVIAGIALIWELRKQDRRKIRAKSADAVLKPRL